MAKTQQTPPTSLEGAIDRRQKLSVRDFRREYLEPGRPVVIEGALGDWPCFQKWSWEFFAERYGDSRVFVSEFRSTNRKDTVEVPMTLRDVIASVRANDFGARPLYLRDWIFHEAHPELLSDCPDPRYFPDGFRFLPPFMRPRFPRIFINPAGATTSMHYDIWGTHSWLALLAGRKRFLAYSPDQKAFLYPHPSPWLKYEFQVDAEAPDFERFPLFAKARPVAAEIGPGDLIFIPSRWPHQVRSLEAGLAVTSNYADRGCWVESFRSSVESTVVPRVQRWLPGRKKKALKLADLFSEED